jgi:hypothetical protein
MNGIPITVILAVALSLFLASCNDPRGQAQRNEQTMRPIVAALHRYKEDNSQFPASLQSLAPKYLSKIPVPEGKHTKWDYRLLSDGTGFHLICYGQGSDLTVKYWSETNSYSWADD